MKTRGPARYVVRWALSGLLLVAPQSGRTAEPTPGPLTLDQAEKLALANAPRLQEQVLAEQAANQEVRAARAGYFPTLSANVTGAVAQENTVITAGAVATSSLSSRAAIGATLSQLITDFGRTSDLVTEARMKAVAAHNQTDDERVELLLNVREAYYGLLAAQSESAAVQAALDSRRVTLRQVSALVQREIKSTLDLGFAQVLVSDAELGVYRAEADVAESRARLLVAVGAEDMPPFGVVEVAVPAELGPDVAPLLMRAFADRPDLQAAESRRQAAYAAAEAKKALSYPTLTLQGVAGWTPVHDPTVHVNDYAAAGINLHVPLFNGFLYSAEQEKASLEAHAADREIEDLRLRIAREVRTAWFEAMNAFRRVDVTARMSRQASDTLRLAQARYDSGLGSIVELNEAQVRQTSAALEASRARYDYLSRRADLDHATGDLQKD